jgi:hypothetical protein
MNRNRKALYFSLAAIIASHSVANAAMDAKAVQVAAKAIGFVKPNGGSGDRIDVVGGAATLSDVQSVLSSYKVAAGDGNGAFAAFVSNAAEAKAAGAKVLTIGPLACVEAGACVLGIETSPKVTIYISNAAAAAAGLDFDPNFKLMVTAK